MPMPPMSKSDHAAGPALAQARSASALMRQSDDGAQQIANQMVAIPDWDEEELGPALRFKPACRAEPDSERW